KPAVRIRPPRPRFPGRLGLRPRLPPLGKRGGGVISCLRRVPVWFLTFLAADACVGVFAGFAGGFASTRTATTSRIAIATALSPRRLRDTALEPVPLPR